MPSDSFRLHAMSAAASQSSASSRQDEPAVDGAKTDSVKLATLGTIGTARHRQRALGCTLPLVTRSSRCPGETAVPPTLAQMYKPNPKASKREPQLYVLVIGGEVDGVIAGWYQTEVDAPAYVEVATHEWPGHGCRENEPPLLTAEALAWDAYETFREAMSIGHFILVGDSTGTIPMTILCERAKRELHVEPQAVIVVDRGPPHLPIFSAYGAELLLHDTVSWFSMWKPDIAKLYAAGRISKRAFERWAADMRLENDTLPIGYFKFPCRVSAVLALQMSEDFPPEDASQNWIQERRRSTRTGRGYSFDPHEYDQWRKWADDVWIYEVDVDHDNISKHQSFKAVLWNECRRVLRPVVIR